MRETAFYVSSYYCLCVLILLSMCPHTSVYVSSYYYVYSYYCLCVLILLSMCTTLSSLHYMCPHTTVCVLILLYMCPHTTTCVRILLLYMCPHSTMCPQYYYVCVLILYIRPHTTTYLSSHCHIFFLVSSYYHVPSYSYMYVSTCYQICDFPTKKKNSG